MLRSGAFIETPLVLPLFVPVEIALLRDGQGGDSEVLAFTGPMGFERRRA
jgi:hypothetical protein